MSQPKLITTFRKEGKEFASKYAKSKLAGLGNITEPVKQQMYLKYYKEGLGAYTRKTRQEMIEKGIYNPTVAASSKGALKYKKRLNLTSTIQTTNKGKDIYAQNVQKGVNVVKKSNSSISNNSNSTNNKSNKDEDSGGSNWWLYGGIGAAGLGAGYIASKMFSGDNNSQDRYERFKKYKE